jgi:SAM-dependent methyltransferase
MSDLQTRPPLRTRIALNSWGPRLLAAFVIVGVAWTYWAPVLRTTFGPTGAIVPLLHETFTDGSVVPPQQAEVTGYTPCEDGWCLEPGASGTLTYHFTAPPQNLRLDLWFYQPPKGTNKLWISVDGGKSHQTITENAKHTGSRLDLGVRPRPGQPVQLRFDAFNGGDSRALVVGDIKISYRTHPPPVLPGRAQVAALVLSFGLGIVVLCRRWPLALSTVVILAIGAALRFSEAAELVDAVLDPDAGDYRAFGDLMRVFTENGFFSARFGIREPLFVFVVHVYGAVFGSSDFGLRLLTVILSTVSIYAVLRVGRGLFGDIPGQAIGLAMALNGPLIFESARGLRLELELVLCMAYFAVAFLWKWPKALPAVIATSLVGGLLVLTRSTYLPVVVALNAYALCLKGGGFKRLLTGGGFRQWVTGMAVTAAILALCVVPHRYSMYKLYNDPFHDTAVYARWNANMEFAGQPGFPPLAVLLETPFLGPPMTYGEYMFGLHTPTQLAEGTAKGYWKLFRRMEMCAAPGWLPGRSACANVDVVLQALAAIGLVVAAAMSRYRWIPLTFLMLEFPVSFLYDRHLVEYYRHSYSAFPLVLFAATLPLVSLWTAVVRRQRTGTDASRATEAAYEIKEIKNVESPSAGAAAVLPPVLPAHERYRRERTAHWDEVARQSDQSEGWGRAYHRRLEEIYATVVSPGQRVLEIGCGRGDLLAALRPSFGLGVDLSSEMVARARQAHPSLEFQQGDAHDLSTLREPFDTIILSDLINDLWDVQTVLREVRRLSTPRTRVVLNFYSRLWELPLGAAKELGLARPTLHQNWLTLDDTANLLFLADFELVRCWQEVLWPLGTPLIGPLANRYLVKLWPFKHLALSNVVVARPRPQIASPTASPQPTVTVVVPARNEAGNIANAFARTPMMGGGTELIFVEGNSSDDTFATIEREIAAHPEWDSRVFKQTGRGKGDAVRLGYAHAKGDILMILDADLTMPPEDLPRFYEALVSGKAEFANGVRLVYPLEQEAMRFFNLIGNKFFSLAFSWLLGQPIKDTLCGTKVMWRADYERVAANRAYFGDFDPFGDFDLLFGAAKLGLKIVDVPIRYRERTYGETNINRWSHGLLLLRMVVFAARRIKFI